MKYTFNLNSILILFAQKLSCFIVEPLSCSHLTAHLIAHNLNVDQKWRLLYFFFFLIVNEICIRLKSSYGFQFKFLYLDLQILWLEQHKLSRIFFFFTLGRIRRFVYGFVCFTQTIRANQLLAYTIFHVLSTWALLTPCAWLYSLGYKDTHTCTCIHASTHVCICEYAKLVVPQSIYVPIYTC